MNSIKQITNGLSSSLFLAVGLTRLAEKTDPMLKRAGGAIVTVARAKSCEFCMPPSSFTPQTGQ